MIPLAKVLSYICFESFYFRLLYLILIIYKCSLRLLSSYHQCKKDRRHSKTMTKNGLNIQTISTKRTGLQTDRVLLFGQLREKKEKAYPSVFFKISFSQPHKRHIWFCPDTPSQRFAKPKEPFFYPRTQGLRVKY